MNRKSIFLGLTSGYLLTLSSITSAAVIWDESINGDIYFNEFTLNEGTSTLNIVESSGYQNGSFLPNAPFGNIENSDDRFRVTIADGFEITGVSITINNFVIVTDVLNNLIGTRANIFINEVPSFASALSAQGDTVSTAVLDSATSPIEMFSDSTLSLGANIYQFQTTSLLTSWNGDPNADWKVRSEYSVNIDVAAVSAVPVPAAVWLFGSGLLGLVGLARRKA